MIGAIRLEENIERAEAGEKSESRIQLEMERIWRVARDDREGHLPDIPTDELLTALEEVDSDSPIIDALSGLVRWERESDFHDGAVPALEAFEDVVKEGIEKEWYNVGLYAAVQAALVASAVSDDEKTEKWLEQYNDLFGDYWQELTPNTRRNVIDAYPDLHLVANENLLTDLLDTLQSVGDEAADNQDYELQRRILRSIREVLHDRGRSTSKVEAEIIGSYSAEAELKEESPQHKAIVLQEALNSCHEYADEEQLTKWKREMREANRQAIENMPVITHEPEEDELEELERGIEEMIENLRELSTSDSPGVALMTLLANPVFIPRLDAIDSGSEGTPLVEILSRRHMKSEGDSIPDPEEETRPRMYQVGVQHRDNILFAVFRRVISEGIITEGDLYLYLEAVDDLSVHDRSYLTDFVIAFFERRLAEALHLGVPRLEGLIASELKANGYETASLKEGYTTPTPLPGLLRMLEGKVDNDLVEYLKYRYSDISGEGLRNKVAHGRASYQHSNYRICLILLYDIFRTIAWLEDELE